MLANNGSSAYVANYVVIAHKRSDAAARHEFSSSCTSMAEPSSESFAELSFSSSSCTYLTVAVAKVSEVLENVNEKSSSGSSETQFAPPDALTFKFLMMMGLWV